MKPEDVRNLREEMRLTQQELADRLGVSRRSVQKWEGGESEPRARMVGALKSLHRSTVAREPVQKYAVSAHNDRLKELSEEFSPMDIIRHLQTELDRYINIEEFRSLMKVVCKKMNYEAEIVEQIKQLLLKHQ